MSQTSTPDIPMEELHAQSSLVENASASMVIIHGYGEHSGRYTSLVKAVNEVGISAYCPDLPGSGHSPGARGRIESVDTMTTAIARYVDTNVSDDRPTFVLGHSLGGLILTRYLLETRRTIAGAIFSSPAFLPYPILPAPLRPLIALIARIAPRLPAWKVNLNKLSRDPKAVQAVKNDLLYYHGFIDLGSSMAFSSSGFETIEHLHRIDLPVLILQGSADAIVSPNGAYRLYEQAQTDDKTLTVFEGGYHEPLHDTVADEAIGRVVEWITERLDSYRMSN
jgi:acylglycerol lipase